MRDFIDKFDKTIEASILYICDKTTCSRGFTKKVSLRGLRNSAKRSTNNE